MSPGLLPQVSDIEAAERRLDGYANVTPLLESSHLNSVIGARLLIKPECLQRTGSFKFRGAFNKIVQIPKERRARGVVAFSSGNHAQGVSLYHVYPLSTIQLGPCKSLLAAARTI